MAKRSVPHHQAGLPAELYWVRILTHIMSESDATALDCTETSNIGDGAESAHAETNKYGACSVCGLILFLRG